MEKIRETKYNEWFRNTFLESFGHCKGKQISEKQGLIFEKYLKEDPENWRHANAFYYSGIISGKKDPAARIQYIQWKHKRAYKDII